MDHVVLIDLGQISSNVFQVKMALLDEFGSQPTCPPDLLELLLAELCLNLPLRSVYLSLYPSNLLPEQDKHVEVLFYHTIDCQVDLPLTGGDVQQVIQTLLVVGDHVAQELVKDAILVDQELLQLQD